ncbi:hypothetical protein ACFWPX_03560 [Nocardia sp. NPDC058518]|uniref:hypothetical protein n=1 Tax=Nocardia sp. NPDC058518 TaxID=3346534 RepID=UPI00364B5A0D
MESQQRQRSRSGAMHGARRVYSAKPPRTPGEETNSSTTVDDGAVWVRSTQRQLELLASRHSIDPDMRTIIEFAISWAPFGGASPGDLLVNFGVDRGRFMALVQEGLRTRRADRQQQRLLKRQLAVALTSAWRDVGGSIGEIR